MFIEKELPGSIRVFVFLAERWIFPSQLKYIVWFRFLIYLNTHFTDFVSFMRQNVPTNWSRQWTHCWKRIYKQAIYESWRRRMLNIYYSTKKEVQARRLVIRLRQHFTNIHLRIEHLLYAIFSTNTDIWIINKSSNLSTEVHEILIWELEMNWNKF